MFEEGGGREMLETDASVEIEATSLEAAALGAAMDIGICIDIAIETPMADAGATAELSTAAELIAAPVPRSDGPNIDIVIVGSCPKAELMGTAADIPGIPLLISTIEELAAAIDEGTRVAPGNERVTAPATDEPAGAGLPFGAEEGTRVTLASGSVTPAAFDEAASLIEGDGVGTTAFDGGGPTRTHQHIFRQFTETGKGCRNKMPTYPTQLQD